VRDQFVREHPTCVECGAPTQEVHHKIPVRQAPHLRLEPSNLVPYCKRCHSSVTATAVNAARRAWK
jgi:5-methylcytosine-specific restriction endonuclease McrA